MSKKQLLDQFLREALNGLPEANVPNFSSLESKMAAKKQRGLVWVFIVPMLISGLYWLSNFTEKDLFMPANEIAKPEGTEQLILPITEEVKAQSFAVEEVAIPTESVQTSEPLNGASSSTNRAQKTPYFSAKSTRMMSEAKSPLAGNTVYEQFSSAEVGIDSTKIIALTEPKERFKEESDSLIIAPSYVLAPNEVFVDVDEINILDDDVRETGNWSVTMNLYPNYTFREFKINANMANKVNRRYEEIIKESEIGGYAFNLGVDVRYHLGNNLFLGSGLGLVQTKINGNYDFEVDNEPVFDDAGNIYMYALYLQPNYVNQGIIQTYTFLQMPLHVSYQPWVSDKLRLIVEGGFSYIRFLKADGKTIDHQSLYLKDLSEMPYNKNIASMDFKVGLTYYPTPNLAFGLEPTMMYFNSSIYADSSPVYVVPWSVGVNLNLRLRLY